MSRSPATGRCRLCMAIAYKTNKGQDVLRSLAGGLPVNPACVAMLAVKGSAESMSVFAEETKLNLFFDGGRFRIFSVPSFWPYCQPTTYGEHFKETDYLICLDWNPSISRENQIALAKGVRAKCIFFSGTEYTHNIRKEAGLESHLISNNCFVNPDLFQITPASKIYDAVYTARAMTIKRVGLAQAVPNLALIVDRWFQSAVAVPDDAYASVPASYLNERRLNAQELSGLYNQSRCGLILSPREGACFTVTEYLLCGIPVVSTKPEHPMGLGGRELWLNERNSIYVDPTPEAVRAGVEDINSRNLPPEEIRSMCVEEINRNLRKIVGVIGNIFERHNCSEDVYELVKGYSDPAELVLGPGAWNNTHHAKRHRLAPEYVSTPLPKAIAMLAA